MRMMVAVAALIALAGGDREIRAQAPAAADLAARIQARQQVTRDFTADFTQRTTSPMFTRGVQEEGVLMVKKPGRIRLTYKTSDRNEFIADGVTFYSYFPSGRYYTKAPMPAGETASTWLLFLTGRGDVVRDFVHTLGPDQPAGEWHLTLTPRKPQPDFASLELQVDRQSFQLRGLVVVNQAQATTSRYRFANMRENVGLPDREFLFTVPRGVVEQRR